MEQAERPLGMLSRLRKGYALTWSPTLIEVMRAGVRVLLPSSDLGLGERYLPKYGHTAEFEQKLLDFVAEHANGQKP